MKKKTTDSRETCQVGDLPTGSRFFEGDDEYLTTDGRCDEGYTSVVNVRTGLTGRVSNSVRLAPAGNGRLKIWH